MKLPRPVLKPKPELASRPLVGYSLSADVSGKQIDAAHAAGLQVGQRGRGAGKCHVDLAGDQVLHVQRVEPAERRRAVPRGRRPVVVEIPSGDPVVEPGDVAGELGLRLWRAERDAMRFALRATS